MLSNLSRFLKTILAEISLLKVEFWSGSAWMILPFSLQEPLLSPPFSKESNLSKWHNVGTNFCESSSPATRMKKLFPTPEVLQEILKGRGGAARRKYLAKNKMEKEEKVVLSGSKRVFGDLYFRIRQGGCWFCFVFWCFLYSRVINSAGIQRERERERKELPQQKREVLYV